MCHNHITINCFGLTLNQTQVSCVMQLETTKSTECSFSSKIKFQFNCIEMIFLRRDLKWAEKVGIVYLPLTVNSSSNHSCLLLLELLNLNTAKVSMIIPFSPQCLTDAVLLCEQNLYLWGKWLIYEKNWETGK